MVACGLLYFVENWLVKHDWFSPSLCRGRMNSIMEYKNKSAKVTCNTSKCDLENFNSIQAEKLLRDFDPDAMMQLEEVIQANMRRKDEQYVQKHQYAITQFADGRWGTSLYDSAGKRKVVKCSSVEQLNRKIIEHYKQLEQEQAITLPAICKEWLDEKIRHKEITLASHTKYMTDYKRFFLSNNDFCKMPVASITDSDLRRFIKDTIADLNLTKKAYKQLQILLKGALLYAKEEGYTDFSAGTFFADLVLSDRLFVHKARLADETQVFNDGEVQILVDYLWSEQDIRGLGLILLFQTGMRVGELAALRRENIKDGQILISATEETYRDPVTGRKVCEVVDHAKTDAGERMIILPEGAEKTIRAIHALNPFGEFLFMDKLGRVRAKRFNTWLHRACRKVGIPERSTHKIRKTYASILLSNKVDERLVITQMGHSDITTTKNIYYYNRKSAEERRKVISSVINY